MAAYFIYTVKEKSLLQVFVFVALFFSVITSSCNKEKSPKKYFLAEESIYSTQNFNDLVLDSTFLATFLQKKPTSDSIKAQVKRFYVRRAYQCAWLNASGLTHGCLVFYNQLQNYSQDFADTSLTNKRLDILLAAVQTDEKQFLNNKNEVQELELLLTTTFFQYAEKAYSGSIKNTYNLEWFIPRKKKNYQILLDSLVSLSKGEEWQEPVNQYYIRLKEKLRQYRNMQQKGEFPAVITDKKTLSVGDTNVCLLNLKQYLSLTGDLTINDNTNLFTDTLAKAIQLFQHRMGLEENGKLNRATITELNKPIDFRIRQIMVNLERLRWLPTEMEKKYILVNIPAFKLYVFENQKRLFDMKVVVGKEATKTSIFKGSISQIILNPYWVVPKSIVRNEILPKISQNPDYLVNNNMEIVNDNYRQRPGKNNALGKIKFLFPNNFSIYLHDTPAKTLFNQSKRTFSHGCIRIAEPRKLADYLLRNNSIWTAEKIDGILATDNMTSIIVKPTVPVYIAYFTTWVDSAGQVNFRNDLYNLDAKLIKEIFGE
jgi:murein L,D-transpeptidase YcbB/YkuD